MGEQKLKLLPWLGQLLQDPVLPDDVRLEGVRLCQCLCRASTAAAVAEADLVRCGDTWVAVLAHSEALRSPSMCALQLQTRHCTHTEHTLGTSCMFLSLLGGSLHLSPGLLSVDAVSAGLQAGALLRVLDLRSADPVLVAQALWAVNALLGQASTRDQLVSHHQVR